MAAPGRMLLWVWLIAVLTLFGVLTMFVGLIIVFPLIGHATWTPAERWSPKLKDRRLVT